MKTKDTWSDVSPKDKLEILLLDTLANTAVVVAESNSWNVQTRVYGSFWKMMIKFWHLRINIAVVRVII